MKTAWAGEEQNKPLISREMCCIGVLNVVQAQGMLLQCLPCGGYRWWGHHPIPVLLITLSLPVLWRASNLECSAFSLYLSFPPVNFVWVWCRDVQGAVWPCSVAVGLSARCSMCNINLRDQANPLTLVSFPLLTSCVQTRVIQISSELEKSCLKNTQRCW